MYVLYGFLYLPNNCTGCTECMDDVSNCTECTECMDDVSNCTGCTVCMDDVSNCTDFQVFSLENIILFDLTQHTLIFP